MDTESIIKELAAQYPRGKIVVNEGEVICELGEIPFCNQSRAIAVIELSTRHFHRVTVETYVVRRGTLTLMFDGVAVRMKEGDAIIIPPGVRHSAAGDPTWVEVISCPPFRPGDSYPA